MEMKAEQVESENNSTIFWASSAFPLGFALPCSPTVLGVSYLHKLDPRFQILRHFRRALPALRSIRSSSSTASSGRASSLRGTHPPAQRRRRIRAGGRRFRRSWSTTKRAQLSAPSASGAGEAKAIEIHVLLTFTDGALRLRDVAPVAPIEPAAAVSGVAEPPSAGVQTGVVGVDLVADVERGGARRADLAAQLALQPVHFPLLVLDRLLCSLIIAACAHQLRLFRLYGEHIARVVLDELCVLVL